MFVNMPQRHIIQTRVVDQIASQYQFVSEHHHPLAAIFGSLHAGMGGQDQRQRRVSLLNKPLDNASHLFFNVGEHFLRRLPFCVLPGHKLAAR